MLERVVVPGVHARLDVAHFLSDGDHSVAEAVQLSLGFRLGGLDHQCAGDRPRHGGRVEPVVHQTLRHVLRLHTADVLEGAQVDDELVRARAVLPAEQHRVVVLEALGHVVGVEDRALGRVGEPRGSHHGDVGEGDGEDERGAVGRAGDDAEGSLAAVGRGAVERCRWVVGHERHEVRLDADGAHAGSTAAVRDAERLVQVEVAHVGADEAGGGEAHLRVHVGAVHVHLAAVLVDQLAHALDAILVHAVRRRVRDHERREVGRVLLHRRGELGDVDVTLCVGAHHHDLHAAHRRRRRVGAVRRHGDDAHVTVVVPA
mmetsp:Transcript_27393/g.68598  ORF Transcript_27393/g.68598 Transcript_27393/m.68598 type:complete len:316 (+) Transcript_27393:598-1545(+)